MENAGSKGWRVENHDRIIYESSGNVRLTVKVQLYAEYRQIVKPIRIPERFKSIKKGVNRFLMYRGIVGKRGILDITRVYDIIPIPVYYPPEISWGLVSEIPEHIRKRYGSGGRYWPTQSSILEGIKNQKWFQGDSLRDWIAGAVNFLRARIEFPEPQNERFGAERAYELRRGDCDEFTDLLVTIARMRGIPARRLTGFFIHEKEEPHAWAEIYSPHGWIPVDAALMRVGEHSWRYIVMKVEEFNPSIGEYRFEWKGGKFRYEIERTLKIFPL